MRRRWAVAAVLTGMALAAPATAAAVLTAAAASTASYGTAVLADPAEPAATIAHCQQNQAVHVGLEWEATPSAFADGYEIRRVADDGPEQTVGLVTHPDLTQFVDNSTTWETTYTYTVVATAGWWRSAGSAPATITTPRHSCNDGGGGGGPPGGGSGPPGGGGPPGQR